MRLYCVITTAKITSTEEQESSNLPFILILEETAFKLQSSFVFIELNTEMK